MPFLIALLLMLAAAPAAAHTRSLAEVEVYDRSSGQVLPQVRHRGRLYVAGEPGHEYEIRVRSHDHRRVLAVTSVDGVNVITGQTAATSQSGYVLDPHGAVDIAGWRKSSDRIATFYFTALPDSYAARTGRPDDVGVIGVALFREQEPERAPWREDRFGGAGRAQDAAPAQERDAQASAPQAESKLGTGHGRSQESWSRTTTFERASAEPDQVITIWYDARRNLVAQGVIREPHRHAQRRAEPFPAGGFVPDP